MESPRNSTGTGQGERVYRNLFDEAPISLFSVGTDGRIRMANRRALQLLGYQSDEIISRCVLDLYTAGPTGKVRAWDVFGRFCAGLEIPGRELEMRRADGTGVWVRLFVQPIRDAEGRVVASCCMAQEIGQPQRVEHNPSRRGKGIANPLISSPDSSGATEKYPERVQVKSAGCAYFLSVNEIDWLGASGNYVELHVGSRSYLVRRTMNDLEDGLDPCRFLRIHRSTIVNAERIKELHARSSTDYDVILRDGTQLSFSRSYRKKLRGLLGNVL